MMLTQLADVARRTGRPVVEVAGWKTRGHGPMLAVNGVVCHHTAGPRTGNYPSLNIVTHGRPDLGGPLAHYGIGRDGTIYVIAAGLCWHAGPAPTGWTNSYTIGIEAENTGTGEPWGAPLMASYRLLCRALATEFRFGHDHVRGHKEIALPLGRKSDPTFDMSAFRASLSGVDATVPEEDPLMSVLEGLDFSDPTHHPQDGNRLDVLQLLLAQAGMWIAPNEHLVVPDRSSQDRYTNIRNVLGTFQVRTGTGTNGQPDYQIGPRTAAALCQQKVRVA